MKILVIDTATRACSVALFEGNNCIASDFADIGRGHAERLIPMVAGLPGKGCAQAIHVNIGPGSFTGIRVGVSAARALALAWGVPCHGYGCMDMLAHMSLCQNSAKENFTVVMQGGHGEYFVNSYDPDGRSHGAPISVPIDTANARVQTRLVIGDAAQSLVTARGFGDGIHMLPDAKYWPAISHLPGLTPSPFYGRDADAKLPPQVKPHVKKT